MTKPKSPKIPRRKASQARSRDSVNAIVEASAQILREHGYKGATTNRIAARAGVSVGSLYQYFNNKDEIFDELITREASGYLQALAQSMPGPELPLREALRRLLAAGYANQHLILGIRTAMRHLPSTHHASRSRQLRQELNQLVVRFLELRKPIPGLEDLSLAADIMIAQCEGITYLGRVDRTAEELIEILTDSLSRYLLAGPGVINTPRPAPLVQAKVNS